MKPTLIIVSGFSCTGKTTLHCYAPKEIALARFQERELSGARHPGHVDHLILGEMAENFNRGGYEILDICDRTLKVEVYDFAVVDWEKIFQWLIDYLLVNN